MNEFCVLIILCLVQQCLIVIDNALIIKLNYHDHSKQEFVLCNVLLKDNIKKVGPKLWLKFGNDLQIIMWGVSLCVGVPGGLGSASWYDNT